VFYNYAFFTQTLKVYAIEENNLLFLGSLVIVLSAVTALVLTLLSTRWTIKFFIITLLLISSMTAYFMDSYQVIIDDDMIRNMMQTDMQESLDLLSFKQVLYFLFLGLLPAYLVYKTPLKFKSIKIELLKKIKQIILLLVIITLAVFTSYSHYSSFAREHKPLRFMTNPSYWIYSIGFYMHSIVSSNEVIVKIEGEDAKMIKSKEAKPKIVIMVVGEATRADHFSLNGYDKKTTPKLEQLSLINFSNMYACGTSTAVSVPCMFSFYTRKTYTYKKGLQRENVLDVLKRSNEISVLWLDNNSDSKGVALRVPYLSYKYNNTNTICVQNGECRDEGMLVGLEAYIASQKNKDILIILHQMGNHGPAYYKRYPKAYKKFIPICETNQLENCSPEEISNAYDNAILYTDYFLSKTIDLLKTYNKTHQTALFYMSDHGESLGENGLYLHGLPYFMAPQGQTHIPAFLWLNQHFKNTINSEIDVKKHYSQDNLSHTLLGLFNVQTKVYDKDLDIFAD